MNDHRRRPPLRLRPRRSDLLGLMLVVTHLLAALVLLLMPLALEPRALLLLLVMLSLGYGLWAQWLALAPWSVREAVWTEQGWQLRFRNGQQRQAVLLPSTLISVRLVILHFRVGWLRYPQLILTEAVIDRELMRRLRVRLRLQGTAA
ncbi:MAG: hypothetical protein C1943_08020 [Halochromatium sp.]|nr:hypothetical protein [Halochromatium sp.]